MSTITDILQRVSVFGERIEDGGQRAEELGTCPLDLVDDLRIAGLFSLKVPAAVRGLELSWIDQMRVFEEIARLDSNVGWTVILGNGAAGSVGIRLSDKAAPRVFGGPTPPLIAASIAPPGVAQADGDGYRVTGRASFATGIRHAEWVMCAGMLADAAGTIDASLGPRMFVVPADAVTVHDNWDVAGLQGTGSCDFSIEDVHVDHEFVIDIAGDACRGGPVFRMPAMLFGANEHLGFTLGVARRALEEATRLAQTKLRLGSTTTIAHQGRFQAELADHELAFRSARLLAFDTIGRVSDLFEHGQDVPAETLAEVMAVATYVNNVAVDGCMWAFKSAGAHGLYRSHPLQRCLRDMIAAGNHFYVKDENLDVWGRSLLGIN
jgi:alkylation response protein AidB-like acyl-CoA dehydrogenase